MFENSKIAVFEGKWGRFRNFTKLSNLTVTRIIDQFERKRCQKKREDVSYQLLQKLFRKYFVVDERSAVTKLVQYIRME